MQELSSGSLGSTFDVPGAYLIEHIATGKVYVGSSECFRRRKVEHTYELKKGKHHCKELQKLYNEDPKIRWFLARTHNREDAFYHEQRILDDYRAKGLALNFAEDVRCSIVTTNKNPEVMAKAIAARRRLGATEKQRAATRLFNLRTKLGTHHSADTKEKMRLAHTSAKRRAQRAAEIASKERAVSIDGVRYKSIREAIKALGRTYSHIDHRLRSTKPKHKDWFWL